MMTEQDELQLIIADGLRKAYKLGLEYGKKLYEDKLPKSENAWGPGSLEDYLKLSGQAGCTAVEAFDIFIRRNVPANLHAHLLDSDDNDGEFVRRAIRDAIWRNVEIALKVERSNNAAPVVELENNEHKEDK